MLNNVIPESTTLTPGLCLPFKNPIVVKTHCMVIKTASGGHRGVIWQVLNEDSEHVGVFLKTVYSYCVLYFEQSVMCVFAVEG